MSATDSAGWPAYDDALVDQLSATQNFTLGRPGAIWISPDGQTVLFTRSGPRSPASQLYAFDVQSGTCDSLLAAQDLLGSAGEQISEQEKARRERLRQTTRGITSFSTSADGQRILIPLSGRLFLHDRTIASSNEVPTPGGIIDPRISPDGKLAALAKDGELFTVDIDTGRPLRISPRATDTCNYGIAEFVAQEEMDRMHGYWWSPDSKRIAFQKSDVRPVEVLWVHDATHPAQPPVPFRYPRAGKDNVVVELGITGALGGDIVWVSWDRETYPYLATVKWPEAGQLTLVVMNRLQTEAVVLAADTETGTTRELLTETDPAWINLDQSMPCWLPDGSGFLWTTERNGAWQLELRNPSGELVRTLTEPDLGLRSVLGVTDSPAEVWLTAAAEPRFSALYRVPLTGGAPVPVIGDPGEHHAVVMSNSSTRVIVSHTPDGKSRYAVHDSRGEVGLLESVSEEPLYLPEVDFQTVELDGRSYRASVVRPRAYQAGSRYSVIVHVYGGPHAFMVKNDPRAYVIDQFYADSGFVVVRIDGRGTPFRGRDWERAIHLDMMTPALADQVAVVRALAERSPEMDADQIGIVGWSFGGYMATMAALLAPDVFKAAVAGAPVTDWLDYDTFYTERYMGLPEDNPDGYRHTSALTHANKLSRPLLLIHGTTDDNVYFTHSLALSQALFRAERHFEILPLAGFTHMVPDPAVKRALVRRISEFFRTHLRPPVLSNAR